MKLSYFQQGYVDCAIWLNSAFSTDTASGSRSPSRSGIHPSMANVQGRDKPEEIGEAYDGLSISDIPDHVLTTMLADCDAFLAGEWSVDDHGSVLTVQDVLDQHYDLARAGHDFFLTRNRHGAGFWDGGYSFYHGQDLTKIAHSYGSQNLIVHVIDGEVTSVELCS